MWKCPPNWGLLEPGEAGWRFGHHPPARQFKLAPPRRGSAGLPPSQEGRNARR